MYVYDRSITAGIRWYMYLPKSKKVKKDEQWWKKMSGVQEITMMAFMVIK